MFQRKIISRQTLFSLGLVNGVRVLIHMAPLYVLILPFPTANVILLLLTFNAWEKEKRENSPLASPKIEIVFILICPFCITFGYTK